MKISKSVQKLLTNKWVLNIIFVLAMITLIFYIIIDDLNSILFFIFIAITIRYFSKNMIIILGVPFLVLNLIHIANSQFSLFSSSMEGFDSKNNTTNSKNIDSNKSDNSNNGNSNSNNTGNNSNNNNNDTQPSLAVSEFQKGQNQVSQVLNSDSAVLKPSVKTTADLPGKATGAAKQKSSPINYSATIEDAYDDLNKILGGDGINRLTSDTQKLIKQQQQLAESMTAMQPLIQNMLPLAEQAQSMMSSMNSVGGGKEMNGSVGGFNLGNISEMINKLSPNKNDAINPVPDNAAKKV
jgi:hypothetical protein